MQYIQIVKRVHSAVRHLPAVTKPLMVADAMLNNPRQEWIVWTDDDVYINTGEWPPIRMTNHAIVDIFRCRCLYGASQDGSTFLLTPTWLMSLMTRCVANSIVQDCYSSITLLPLVWSTISPPSLLPTLVPSPSSSFSQVGGLRQLPVGLHECFLRAQHGFGAPAGLRLACDLHEWIR